MFSPFLSKIVSASSAVHCYAYREKETKETIECTGALRSEVCLYEENWLGTVGFHSGPRPLCELYLLLTWINGLTQYTVRNALSRQNPSLIRRKNPAKFENNCISRNGRRIKSTEPNLMILVSFSSAEDALSNDVKKYTTFRMQGTENPPFHFFGTPGMSADIQQYMYSK